MTIDERIRTIQQNLANNDLAYSNNKRDKRTWLVCKRDGKARIAELRAEKRKQKRLKPKNETSADTFTDYQLRGGL